MSCQVRQPKSGAILPRGKKPGGDFKKRGVERDQNIGEKELKLDEKIW